jgi:hypothetical protein
MQGRRTILREHLLVGVACLVHQQFAGNPG